MRLINCKTRSFEVFLGADIPPYAILSHTWGCDEVSFQDWTNSTPGDTEGFKKIKLTCQEALLRDIEYAWVDTCCIDKTSSAELSEAINAMYEYYFNAAECYVYLSDVKDSEGAASRSHEFRQSRWFTRGWTLQELIAPKDVLFFTQEWHLIGKKGDLSQEIAEITGIDRIVLLDRNVDQYSIAQRMSWASKRETTRVEDIAYCLLGIFKINMPLIYGEGHRAFTRLQEEILKEIDDHTLFAWTSFDAYGILAKSPSEFYDTDSVVPSALAIFENTQPVTVTNRGIRIELPLIYSRADRWRNFPYAILNCTFLKGYGTVLAIPLTRSSNSLKSSYNRIRASAPCVIPRHLARKENLRVIFIAKAWIRNPSFANIGPDIESNIRYLHPLYQRVCVESKDYVVRTLSAVVDFEKNDTSNVGNPIEDDDNEDADDDERSGVLSPSISIQFCE